MKKIWKLLVICVLIGVVLFGSSIAGDKKTLGQDLIRLHVVAASDQEADQVVKLQVRDAVIAQFQQVLDRLSSVQEAKTYLSAHLSDLQQAAQQVLSQNGFQQSVTVSLTREPFPTRTYDTFTLPAGVYESLRITIGEGEGHNWWCVVFPSLCLPATQTGFSDTAAGAGFSDGLTGALTGQEGYEVRFFILDCLGALENFFFAG